MNMTAREAQCMLNQEIHDHGFVGVSELYGATELIPGNMTVADMVNEIFIPTFTGAPMPLAQQAHGNLFMWAVPKEANFLVVAQLSAPECVDWALRSGSVTRVPESLEEMQGAALRSIIRMFDLYDVGVFLIRHVDVSEDTTAAQEHLAIAASRIRQGHVSTVLVRATADEEEGPIEHFMAIEREDVLVGTTLENPMSIVQNIVKEEIWQ